MATRKWLGVAMLAALAAAAPAGAAGFDIAGQSARAMGIGGAYTAAVDDPSAIFYNPGALGLLKKKKGVSTTVALSKYNESLYQGLPPGIGAGTTGQQSTPTETLPSAFLTFPFGGSAVAGLGAYSVYRSHTEWADPATFAGRLLAREAEVESYDLVPSIGFHAGSLGIGAGFIYRTSNFSAARRIAADFSGTRRDVADLALKTDSKNGYGWTAGILHRPSPSFSWGVAHRSGTKTDYVGVGRLTQIPTNNQQIDQLVKASFPFDQDLALLSTLELPAQTSAGIAIGSKPVQLSIDATRTQWSRVSEVRFTFPSNTAFTTVYPLRFQDATTFRAGLRYEFPTGPKLRIGFAREESPQPDETVGAFLADANRNTFTAGFGLDWLDVAFAWSTYQQRVITTSADQLNGNWRANRWMVVITATK